jgi:hypothetical protein
MRKNLLITYCVVLFSLLQFSGCRKETKDSLVSSETATDSKLASSENNSKCRLNHIDWGGFFYDFHYNEKGLADEWILDFGDGLPHHYTMEYDKNNRLIKAYDYYNNIIYTNLFEYTGNLITKHTWTSNITAEAGEVIFTYNKKGEMLTQDDIINDVHVTFVYGPRGCIHWDFYIGNALYLSDDFTYSIPNRNPFLAIPGLSFAFPLYAFGTWDKWWNTSDRFVLYDNGNPIILYDYDPAQTVMQTGHQNYLTSVSYYDRVSESTVINTFTYENCGGQSEVADAESSQGKRAVISKNRKAVRPLLLYGSQKQIKEQIKQLRNQNGR